MAVLLEPGLSQAPLHEHLQRRRLAQQVADCAQRILEGRPTVHVLLHVAREVVEDVQKPGDWQGTAEDIRPGMHVLILAGLWVTVVCHHGRALQVGLKLRPETRPHNFSEPDLCAHVRRDADNAVKHGFKVVVIVALEAQRVQQSGTLVLQRPRTRSKCAGQRAMMPEGAKDLPRESPQAHGCPSTLFQ